MKKIITGLLAVSAFSATTAMAQNLEIEVTNLTNGTYFTPLLYSAHNRHADVFEVGTPASDSLQAMAEGGNILGLASDLAAIGANVEATPDDVLLAPGASASVSLKTNRGNNHLSVVAMLLPTNDGFVGADAIKIPYWPGTYTYYLNGYDAGTEANDEQITGGGAPGAPGIPADPGGNNGINGTGVTGTDHNPTVHVHRGIIGDAYPIGGSSDLDSAVHRWINPVAKLVITVKKGH